MNYYLDTEFLEGTQKKSVLGINYGNTKPTIDLISIGIVSEDNRKYYAVSKEFNLKEAWNRYDLKPDIDNGGMKKVYWIRENVLKPIWEDYLKNQNTFEKTHFWNLTSEFSYKTMKRIIKWTGKSNQQITEEIKEFVFPKYANYDMTNKLAEIPEAIILKDNYWMDKKYLNPEFYVYYGDYDWVVFCWLFGKMVNLPSGFPYYAKDLKQIMDEKAEQWRLQKLKNGDNYSFEHCLSVMKHFKTYPKQMNEHNALSDAIWNKELHEFLNTLK